MIKVILVEDQAMVRGALSALLDMESDIEVVGEAESGEQALKMLGLLEPDVVLTDIEMPGMSGLELAEKAKLMGMKVLVLTTFNRSGYVRRAIDLKLDGFVLKEAPSTSLAEAIRLVMKGQKVFDTNMMLQAIDKQDPLSKKSRKALSLAAEGLSTADIAQRLFLSEGTVRNYLSNAINLLGASNRIEAARIARCKGWL